jgi:hypothetical protein
MVAAVATAGMLALSPLAFAGEKDGHGDRQRDRSSETSVSVEDNSVERNQVNQCDLSQESTPALLGLLPSQIQMFNCVNIGDGSTLVPSLLPALPLG